MAKRSPADAPETGEPSCLACEHSLAVAGGVACCAWGRDPRRDPPVFCRDARAPESVCGPDGRLWHPAARQPLDRLNDGPEPIGAALARFAGGLLIDETVRVCAAVAAIPSLSPALRRDAAAVVKLWRKMPR